MFKLLLLVVVGVAFFEALPQTALRQHNPTIQCISEERARKYAEQISLPEYPEEIEPGSSQGVVFAAVLFGTDGRLSKIKFYETPTAEATEAVRKALQKWKLMELYDGGQQRIMTRTALRFHFVFEDGKGRVDLATEQEQNEFGGDWGKRACRSALD